jgi:hypothetical protein
VTLAERLSTLKWGGEGFAQYQGFGKGEHSSAEQSAADQQRQLEDSLMQQQLGMFQKQMGSVNAVLNPMIAQGGLPPQVVAALRSQALNGLGQQFKAGVGQTNQALVARGMVGGPMAGSGGVAQGFGSLNALEAGLQTNALNQIPLEQYNALMGELQTKMGIGSQFGGLVPAFSAGANNALSSGVTAAHNADTAASSFWGPLIGGLAGMGANFATGGLSGAATSAFGGMSPTQISGAFGGPAQAPIQTSPDTTGWSV